MRLGVGDVGRASARRRRAACRRRCVQAPTTSRISASSTIADQRADRQILQEALAQFGEVDVQHHHDEQEQHRDRADIDDDQDHRQKLGAQQQEQAGRVDEGEDQEQHRMHGIARRNHHQRGGDAAAAVLLPGVAGVVVAIAVELDRQPLLGPAAVDAPSAGGAVGLWQWEAVLP